MKRRAKMADQPRKWFSGTGMLTNRIAIKPAPAKTALCLLSLVALVPALCAAINDATPDASAPADASSDQPYSAIWVRNVFDLKPAPPPPDPNKGVNLPPPNVKLEGITTIFGNKRAYLSLVEPAPPGHPVNKEEFLTMTEGERHGTLEVLEINPPAATAKIKIDENVSVIAIETNKPAGGGAPPVAPGGMVRSPGFQQPPPGTPMQLPPRTTRPSAPGFSQGTVSPQGYGQPVSATGYGYGAGVGATGYGVGTQTPGLAIPGSLFTQASPQTIVPAVPTPSAEEQAALIAIQNQLHASEIAAGKMPPLPPIPGLTDGTGNSGGLPGLPAPTQTRPPNFGQKATGSLSPPPGPP